MYFVYILHSRKDGKLYTGYTPDLLSRLKAHKLGFVKATKYRRPLIIIHYEAYTELRDARKREKFLKGGNGKEEIESMLSGYFQKYPWNK